MTKKDFIAIANVLNENVADLALVSDFADMCEESNPLFNRQVFVQASTHKLRAVWSSNQRLFEAETK